MTRVGPAVVLLSLCLSSAVSLAGTPDYLNDGANYARAYRAHERDPGVLVNGRCDGVSYGTGARRCGTATGGPAGGITGRN